MNQMFKCVKFSILIVLFITAELCYSQAFNFTIYSVNEGLPHAQVTDLIQTSDSYMWIGTSGGGVSRFDGRIFETYTADHGLKDDFVNVLFEDSQKRLWVATYYGGVTYLQNDRFINPFEGHSIDESYVTFIDESPDGHLWIGTFENGLYIFDGDSLNQITTEDGLISNTVWHVLWQGDGQMYISTHEGISVYDGTGYINYKAEDGLSGEKVFKGIEDRYGQIWFATSNGITKLNEGQFTTITEIDGRNLRYIYDIHLASDNKIWIGTENDGVFRFTDSSNEYIHITKRDGLSSNYIHRFFEDSEGKIWIATDENGINRFEGESFRVFNTAHGLPSNEILSLYRDRDGITWIGTNRGLTSYDGERFHTFELPNHEADRMYVWDIQQLSNDDLLVVDYYGHIYQFDGSEFTLFDISGYTDDIYVYDILIDSNNHLWIGSEEGLHHFADGSVTHYTTDDGLPGILIFHIYEGSDGMIWLGTNNGLSRFDGNSFRNILPSEGLSHYNINHITEGVNGELWLGTSGGVTLVKHFPENDSELPVLENFGRNHGMLLVETLFLWLDHKNQTLWQGTNGGLQSLNLKTYAETGEMQIEHHRLSRFGIGIEATHKALFESEGKLWFASMQGVVILDPEQINIDQKPPQLYLTDVLVNGNQPDWNTIGIEPEYELGRFIPPNVTYPHGSTNYTFHFAGLEFQTPERVQYRYRLDGLDSEWNSPTGNQSVTYANLGSGSYTFEVQARNGMGPWSDITQYPFSIASPFWLSVWFFIIILAGAVLLTAAIVWLYYKKLERERLRELVEEKTEHLLTVINEKEVLVKEIHHRVKNNLAMIIGLLELQASSVKDESTVNTLRDSILRIYSMSLVHEKLYTNDQLTAVDVRYYFSDLIQMISHSMNLDKKKIRIESDIDSFKLTLDHGITCGLLLNELVTNAVKHAFNGNQEGLIHVRFLKNGSVKTLEIKDNGNGLPEQHHDHCLDSSHESEFTSLGLTLIHTLTQQLEGSLQIDSSDQGTQFTITF